jgi:hypothetical protein
MWQKNVLFWFCSPAVPRRDMKIAGDQNTQEVLGSSIATWAALQSVLATIS